MENIINITNSLSNEAQTFFMELCKVTGNCYSTSEGMKYYRSDLYTWFDPKNLRSKYTPQEIGGFLKHLEQLGLVQLDGEDTLMTIEGVEVGILLFQRAEAETSPKEDPKPLTLDQQINSLKPGESMEVSQCGNIKVIAERSCDGKRLKFVRVFINGFKVFREVAF